MKMKFQLLILISVTEIVLSRDFYIGMFKKNDFLVAQDRLYKDKTPFGYSYRKYGRVFKCPITYLRVVDRLGRGRGPTVQIIRGGLQKSYVVLRLISSYNLPISVNIYVGCSSVKITRPTLPPEPSSNEYINQEVNISSREELITTGKSVDVIKKDEDNYTTRANVTADDNGTTNNDITGVTGTETSLNTVADK